MTAENVPFLLKITVDDTIVLRCPCCPTIAMNHNDQREGRNRNHVLMDKKVFVAIPSSSSVTSIKDILEDFKRKFDVQGSLKMYIEDYLVPDPSTRVNISRLQDMNIKVCPNPDCVVLEGVTPDIDANVDADVDTDAHHGNEDSNLNPSTMSFLREPLFSSTPRHGHDGNEDENVYGSPHETESFMELSESFIDDDEAENEDESNVEDSLNSEKSVITRKALSVIPEAQTEVEDFEEHHNDEVLDPEDVEENSIVSNKISEETGSWASTSTLILTGSESSIKIGPGQSHRQTNDNGDFVTRRKRMFSSTASDDSNTTNSFSFTSLSWLSSSSGTSYPPSPKTMKMDSDNVSSQVGTSQSTITSKKSVSSPSPSGSPVNRIFGLSTL